MPSLPRTALAVAVALIATTAADAQTRLTRDPVVPAKYILGPDSLPQKGVKEGKLEGPTLFKSKVIKDTVRKYWVHVPAQYTGEKPACVLVFQDGARAINPKGVLRIPQVLDNLIAKKQIPVTIGIFITPGQRGDTFPDTIGTGNPNNRDREYDTLTDDYAKMVIDEILPEVGKTYKLATEPENRAIGGDRGAEALDAEAVAGLTRRLERIHEARQQVEVGGSPAAVDTLDELAEEEHRIVTQLGRDLRPGRGSRVLGDVRNRVRNRVGNAVRRALKLIQKYDPALAAHLNTPTLRLGHHLCYSPRSNPAWAVSG